MPTETPKDAVDHSTDAIVVSPRGGVTIKTGAVAGVVAILAGGGVSLVDGLFGPNQTVIERLDAHDADHDRFEDQLTAIEDTQKQSTRLVKVIYRVMIKDNPDLSISLEDLNNLDDQ